MKNINFRTLIQSFLLVFGFILGMFTLAFVLSRISQEIIFGILGLGAFGLLWYIAYDILKHNKKLP